MWGILHEGTQRAAGRAGALLRRALGSRTNDPLGILVYHRVARNVPGVPRPTMNVTPERFRRQLAGLLRLGFRFWPLGRVLHARSRGEAIPERTAVVTFDDGFENVHTHAWPVMRELSVPGTIFISTAFLDSRQPFPFDSWGCRFASQTPSDAYVPLTRAQCHAMLQSGLIELGAHTHTHQDFRGRPGDFREDMKTCVNSLRREFGLDDVTFAFPFGRPHLGYTADDLMQAARDVGVTCALTTEAVTVDPRRDPFGWGRFNAYDWDTGETLAAKLSGWYGWAPRLQERLSRRTPAANAVFSHP